MMKSPVLAKSCPMANTEPVDRKEEEEEEEEEEEKEGKE